MVGTKRGQSVSSADVLLSLVDMGTSGTLLASSSQYQTWRCCADKADGSLGTDGTVVFQMARFDHRMCHAFTIDAGGHIVATNWDQLAACIRGEINHAKAIILSIRLVLDLGAKRVEKLPLTFINVTINSCPMAI